MEYHRCMRRKNNAIYIDLENIPTALDLKLLIDELTLRHNESPDEENIFVIKMACGNSKSIKRLEKQLWSTTSPSETPFHHGDAHKNRADLIISLEALETIIINMPVIDRYVFITSDSDFTVIMEMQQVRQGGLPRNQGDGRRQTDLQQLRRRNPDHRELHAQAQGRGDQGKRRRNKEGSREARHQEDRRQSRS